MNDFTNMAVTDYASELDELWTLQMVAHMLQGESPTNHPTAQKVWTAAAAHVALETMGMHVHIPAGENAYWTAVIVGFEYDPKVGLMLRVAGCNGTWWGTEQPTVALDAFHAPDCEECAERGEEELRWEG